MPEAIISAKGTEAPTVRSGRFTTLHLHSRFIGVNVLNPCCGR